MNLVQKIVLVGMFFLQTNWVVASDCQEIPSCSSLGFNMTLEQCSTGPVLRCPFDRTNEDAVWCHKGMAGSRCLSGNYFNQQTGRCYPKNVSDFVFIEDEADLRAIVLDLPATTVIKSSAYDEFIKAGKEDNVVDLCYFHKIEDYLFKKFGVGCYVVADNATNSGSIVYLSGNRIGVKLDNLSFQKYCFSSEENSEAVARASVLKYKIVDYHWR